MPEIRKDPLSDRWVIIAAHRDDRPNEFDHAPPRRIATECPFCRGSERLTPAAVAAYGVADLQTPPAGPAPATSSCNPRADGTPNAACDNWIVRVVPNKYPALEQSGSPDYETVGPYEKSTAVGRHEVIVESPRHVASLAELDDAEIRLLLRAYRDRMVALQQVSWLRYALIFKNVRPEGGASLEHSHSQIVATPQIPVEIDREVTNAQHLYDVDQRCFFCKLLDYEREQQVRWVDQTKHFAAVCPFASRMPCEMWLLPAAHDSHFQNQNDRQLDELALFLRHLIKKLEAVHPHVAYNYFIHTAPFDTHGLRHYHWHIEILPRLTTTAGYEWGAGYFINPLPPENAAQLLRCK